ncbi:hypothetical protein J6590_030236 [Homalodisca vitripennis]|nr:hypothetical protein J6590_030236 [Homalodisca vitripennis]
MGCGNDVTLTVKAVLQAAFQDLSVIVVFVGLSNTAHCVLACCNNLEHSQIVLGSTFATTSSNHRRVLSSPLLAN